MHTEELAFGSTTLASVLSLAFAIIMVYAFVLGIRLRWLLVGAAGWLGLSLYFGLLAISAGPAPVISRGDIADWVRVVLIVSYTMFGIFFGAISRMLLRYGAVWFGWSER
jgi:hypothetical protein